MRFIEARKWTNLLIFLFLDLIQVLFISSIDITESSNEIIAFSIAFNPDLFITFIFIIVIYLIRVVISIWFLIRVFERRDIIQIYPPVGFDDLKIGNFTGAQIRDWTRDISTKSGVKHLSKVFIAKTAIPNAYTVDISPFPFMKNSFVVINSNIAKILTEDEMKSVIAHELGHIRNSDSIIRMILSGPHFFLQVAYLLLYLQILIGIANALVTKPDLIIASIRVLILLIVLIIATFLSDFTISFLRKSNQMAELSSDLYALRVMGHNATINMLIKLGQRTETLETLKNELVWLENRDPYRDGTRRARLILELIESFPETEIDDQRVRQEAPVQFLKKIIRILKDQYYLDLDQVPNIEMVISEASHQLQKERKLFLKENIGDTNNDSRVKKLDWRDFDIDKDSSLSDQEVKQFINQIRVDQEILFGTDTKEQEKIMKNHPSFRRRILNVASRVESLKK
ncbi:MAG: M48 family metallopeptidase [Candidatus Hodarchaeales archaeon]|jgi:heat shock protein HtpX